MNTEPKTSPPDKANGMNRIVRWAPLHAFGAEHFHIQTTAEGFLAQGTVVGSRGNNPYGIFYRINISADWLVRGFEVRETGSSHVLKLTHDGHGHWSSPGGPVPSLDGCIDIDIAATPFTNTLPIRRLRLQEGATQAISVAYIPVPSLQPLPIDQQYTCLEAKLYRYENLTNGYSAELVVDDDGLVVDYPNAFKRA
ncbi:hypothetical protein PLIIFM63780_004257 [Purpureocillium lilacinum]|nr:hypothetical protein PLIIFM63780_004257 [Purpureocillium lilacinum]